MLIELAFPKKTVSLFLLLYICIDNRGFLLLSIVNKLSYIQLLILSATPFLYTINFLKFMAYKKMSSRYYEQAVQRVAGLKAIQATLDLGNGLSVEAYETAIGEIKTTIDSYNTLLAEADTLQNTIQTKEKALRDLSERLLLGVAARFGRDSNEYEKAGGRKKSEIRRSIARKVVSA